MNPATGKMDFLRKSGKRCPSVAMPSSRFSPGTGKAYVYGYGQVLSEANVVRQLKK
jgi:hypothetical protein